MVSKGAEWRWVGMEVHIMVTIIRQLQKEAVNEQASANKHVPALSN